MEVQCSNEFYTVDDKRFMKWLWMSWKYGVKCIEDKTLAKMTPTAAFTHTWRWTIKHCSLQRTTKLKVSEWFSWRLSSAPLRHYLPSITFQILSLCVIYTLHSFTTFRPFTVNRKSYCCNNTFTDVHSDRCVHFSLLLAKTV